MKARLIAIGGAVGAGKSSVATLLANLMRERYSVSLGSDHTIRLLRSDVFRKQLLGVDTFGRLPQKYHDSSDYSRVIYEALHSVATAVRSVGEVALIDATYTRKWQRESLAGMAAAGGFIGFWLDASSEERRRRLSNRERDASDAGPDFVSKQQIEKPANEFGWECVNSENVSPQELAAMLFERLEHLSVS